MEKTTTPTLPDALTDLQKARITEFLTGIERAETEDDLRVIRDALLSSMKPRKGLFERNYTAACGHVIIAIANRLSQL